MHSKKTMIRLLTRILYAGGLVLLVAGLLLSAISSPALASDLPALLNSNTTETLEAYPAGQNCPCETVTSAPLSTNEPDSPSSLVFSSGCFCSCDDVHASVCNVGGDMQEAASWDLFFSASGNPAANGKVVDSGEIGPLDAGQCVDLSFTPDKSGNYAYKIKQEDKHKGPDSVWSNSCMVSGDCFPATATSTPFQPETETPVVTETPPAVEITETESPTERPPLPINLSAVCGYVGESGLIWKVANNTDRRLDYAWRVVGSDERGSGTVRANDVDYFMTSSGDKSVRLFVNDELLDTESSIPACKQAMELSYVCADDGSRQWYVTNPNDFAVDYTFELSTGGSGSGVAAASSTVLVTTSTSTEEERLELTWTDTRPGTHTVSLTAPADSCAVTVTSTPTTPTATRVSPTRTPTVTNTAPSVVITTTPTSTFTNTPPSVVITTTPTPSPTVTRLVTTTHTPTVTNTPPFVVITVTPTPTNTLPVATTTRTPTVTNTAPFVVITVTPTSTVTPTTRVITTTPPPSTLTPTVTNTAPFVVITVTPTTRVITATPQPNTLTPTVTNTAPFVVITTTPPASTLTPTVTNTAPAVVITMAPTTTLTALPAVIFTPTATRINTLAPPVSTVTTTPILIPVTGADMTRTVGVSSLALLGGMFTNTGLFMLGLALALTAFSSQMRE